MKQKRRNRIFGLIGVIWGGLAIVNAFLTPRERSASEAYELGQWLGYLLAGAMFLAGWYFLLKSFKKEE